MINRFKHDLNRELRNLRELINFPHWFLFSANKIVPDNHFYKRKRIKKIQKDNNYDTFIETGTFYGQMVNSVLKYFKKVISIEIYEPLFLVNQSYYKNCGKVEVKLGDSSIVLGEILPQIKDEKILFWLDGHYSGNGTGLGLITSPILNEITIILNSGIQNFCLIIDDMRLFNNTDGYPYKNDVINLVNSIKPNCSFIEDKDSLIITSN